MFPHTLASARVQINLGIDEREIVRGGEPGRREEASEGSGLSAYSPPIPHTFPFFIILAPPLPAYFILCLLSVFGRL